MTLTYEQALAAVRERLTDAAPAASLETVTLEAARGRVLAQNVPADRDYPPFHRSTRDGYAVRAADVAALPSSLECVGEARAGHPFAGKVAPGECVEIMTGAPMPEGADAVVMQEYAGREGARVEIRRSAAAGENVVGRGSEATSGAQVLRRGQRLGAGEIGLLASVGQAQVKVFCRPSIAILPTGDEVVPVERQPQWFEIRNSNAHVLTAAVEAAGGVPRMLGIAPDEKDRLRELIEAGFNSDLMLLSGGISVGRYDLVEQVLRELGAEFYFHGVAIMPGKPIAFGRVGTTFFFGLPGNPVSTFVTFEIFARPAIAALGGAEFAPAVFLRARLGKPVRRKAGLRAFMPARVETESAEPVVKLVGWQGSGDLVGVAAANCFLVLHPEQTEIEEGEWVDVLPKPE
ncbi:MAG TPA: gephyrin-like molybdotransferase Glp [Terriglobia bacterium]|nr:gephyrin-like molybdotransferase Glp [Terriglobia bacterium]